MERPTCKTCPYWQQLSETEHHGECHRGPAKHGHKLELLCDPGKVIVLYGQWFDQYEGDWCGEHPLFPAYLASLKPPHSNNDLSQYEKLRDMLKSASLEELDQILKILSEREREVIKLSFGLAPYVDSYEHSHIARIFKITRERARYIEDKAVKILVAKWIHSQSQHIDKSESHQM